MSRFNELETFIAVVDAGSITKAAERLNLAKSSVSRRLDDLERRLGVQLLVRSTRSLTLTDSGRTFYESSNRLLDDLADAELEVSREHGELAGRIRLAAPLSFGHRHLAPAIAEFLDRHPAVRFDLDLSDRKVNLLEEKFDLAVRIADLDDSSLIARRIAATTHVVCASPGYLERNGTPSIPEDLAEHRCLTYSYAARPGIWPYREPGGAAASIEVESHLCASSGDFLAELACAGHGVVREPDFIVYQAIERGDLVPLLLDWEWSSLAVSTLYPPTRFLSQRVRAFIDFLAERFAGLPYWQQCLEDARRGRSPGSTR